MNISSIINEAIGTLQVLEQDAFMHTQIHYAVDKIVTGLADGGKVMFCGNGGSAADAQHLAAELSGRFYKNRKALRAEALHINTSYLTAVANDYSFDVIYERLIDGIGDKCDVLIALTTSGHSTNIVKAIEKANEIGIFTLVITGNDGGRAAHLGKLVLKI
nr:SIS domain-containing protein [Saprospiraceae bacterium]